jgi:SAM-dependent methyltransferase
MMPSNYTPYPNEHAQYYSGRAAEYDESVGYGKAQFEATVAPLKMLLGNIFKGADVLEIACGTGYWTEALAPFARSIVGIDLDEASLRLAGNRLAAHRNVRLQRADAYSLEDLGGEKDRFSGGFGMCWWSHIPKSKLAGFLGKLQKKLEPGASVVFVDQLPYEHDGRRRLDEEGNLLEQRRLSDGSCYEIVKNFPTETEVCDVLNGFAKKMFYYPSSDGRVWIIHYESV